MTKAPIMKSTNAISNSTIVDRQSGFLERTAERIRDRAKELGLTYSDVLKEVGLKPSSMANYWGGKRPWPVEALVTLADLLRTNVDFLLGRRPANAGVMMSVDAADWVEVPEYDLRAIDDYGKGQPISSTTMRRDWLYLTLSDSTDVWVAKTLGAESTLGLPAGVPLFCKDHPFGEAPLEGQHYLFRVNGGIVLGRFTYRGERDRNGVAVVTPLDLDVGDNQHMIIARILGVLARPLA